MANKGTKTRALNRRLRALVEPIAHVNLTTSEAASRLRTTVGTLANWRVKGQGPKFIKHGRKVLYPLEMVMAYERAQLRENTAA